jgi:hypothetical protein
MSFWPNFHMLVHRIRRLTTSQNWYEIELERFQWYPWESLDNFVHEVYLWTSYITSLATPAHESHRVTIHVGGVGHVVWEGMAV